MNPVDIISNLIKEKGMTEKQFLTEIGLNKSALSDWRAGINKSYEKHAAKIAKYFGVSTDYILGVSKDEYVNRLFSQLTPENQEAALKYYEYLLKSQEMK